MGQISHFESPASLSTMQINRLLRKIRGRCSALAASDTRTAVKGMATYSSKSFAPPDIPPLCILPSPENSLTRIDATTSELARKIYAVRDMFKDVVEKAGISRIQSTVHCPARIPSLTTLCSLIIGEHAEPEVEGDITRWEEEQSVGVVEALYEEIPALYRGWTVVSHTISMILDKCLLGPTLLKLLLEVTLDSNLRYHSAVLLRSLLSIAFSPSTPTRPPPICHSAHSNFLTELLCRWEQGGNSSCIFFRLFNEVMDDVGSFDAWACKATAKLIRKDPLQLTSASCLVRFISKPELHVPSRQFSVSLMSNASPTATLRRSLRVWLDCALYSLLLSVQSIDSCSMAHFLLTCKECWNHLGTPDLSLGVVAQDALPAIISLTTFVLSRGQKICGEIYVQILWEKISPASTTFSPLISPTLALSDQLDECKQQIQSYASSLREHGLLQLEALLWASALREVEHDSLLQRYDKVALYEYRKVLIERVEEAERRCYGLANMSNFPPSITRRSGWQWDAAFGCWTLNGGMETSERRKRPHLDETSSGTVNTSLCSEDEHPSKRKRTCSLPPLLLANALSNRIDLHNEKKLRDCSDEEVVVAPSSDDCLDLFAYPSSPAR
ncbi:hypothetical protein GYMLUDRAFT_846318 [Collybiopsis luxurians FD-317 M1]|nr:hypothetical protein GYMLUDRAFT_846318 [Collybiopsis luxurians FD-317 M1]